jgi:hypothetical protein
MEPNRTITGGESTQVNIAAVEKTEARPVIMKQSLPKISFSFQGQ